MDDAAHIPPHGHSDVALLAAGLAKPADGVDLAYRMLDLVTERFGLAQAYLVLRSPVLRTQIFARGRQPVAPEVVADLLARPVGLYTVPSLPDRSVGAAVAACCDLAVAAQVARRPADMEAGPDLPDIPNLPDRTAVEAALRRVAACGARYGWAYSAVLVTTSGDEAPLERWRALGAALEAASRVGDEVGAAAPGWALVLLGDDRADAAPAFLARVASALAAAGHGGTTLRSATVRVPDETADPEEVWRLADERLPGRFDGGGLPAAGGSGTLPSATELELRRRPGVVAVGVTAPGAGGVARLTLVTTGTGTGGAPGAAAGHVEGFAEPGQVSVVTVVPPSGLDGAWDPDDAPDRGIPGEVGGPDDRLPAGGSPGNGSIPANGATALLPPAPVRVVLVAARFDPSTGGSEVVLRCGERRANGRAAAGPLAGGAQATLAALEVLGIGAPFYLVSAGRARGVPGEPAVVVLAPRRDAGLGGGAPPPLSERIGVAAGAQDVEAASRATLGALNRHLVASRPGWPDGRLALRPGWPDEMSPVP
ncbi:MAG: hypothetical protein ACRDY3_12220 [Acidimicrobiales bacterium]